jgi:hypothetical protein
MGFILLLRLGFHFLQFLEQVFVGAFALLEGDIVFILELRRNVLRLVRELVPRFLAALGRIEQPDDHADETPDEKTLGPIAAFVLRHDDTSFTEMVFAGNMLYQNYRCIPWPSQRRKRWLCNFTQPAADPGRLATLADARPKKGERDGQGTGHEAAEGHLAPVAGTEKNGKAEASAPQKEKMRKGRCSR